MSKIKAMEHLIRAKLTLLASGDVEYHVDDCPAKDLESDDGCIVSCGATCAGAAVLLIEQALVEMDKP